MSNGDAALASMVVVLGIACTGPSVTTGADAGKGVGMSCYPGECAPELRCRQVECYGDNPPTCQAIPTSCPGTVMPVCGCDDQTYANDCLREQSPAALDSPGECVFPSQKVRFGLWSGSGVRMVVTDAGAQLSFGCGSATIDRPLEIDHRFFLYAGLRETRNLPGTFSGRSEDGGAVLADGGSILDGGTSSDVVWTLTGQSSSKQLTISIDGRPVFGPPPVKRWTVGFTPDAGPLSCP